MSCPPLPVPARPPRTRQSIQGSWRLFSFLSFFFFSS
jgi:hypothetical protein